MKKETKKFVEGLRRIYLKAAKAGVGSDAWYILTALRGPDYRPNGEDKSATTAVLRQAVFGDKIASEHVWAESHPDTPENASHRKNGYFSSIHFVGHAKNAFRVLGLSWDEVNPQVK